MIDILTNLADYFRKIPAAFLVAIISVLAMILFLPEDIAKTLAIAEFRVTYSKYLGPALLLTASFCLARIFMFFKDSYTKKQNLKLMQKKLHQLTPEEKGYLVPYINEQITTIYVGVDDGIMSSLVLKTITYRASNMGDAIRGFAFNLQPWARDYLNENTHLLDGATGQPKTPGQRLGF